MGGEGSMLAMIVSYRNNRQMLKIRRESRMEERKHVIVVLSVVLISLVVLYLVLRRYI